MSAPPGVWLISVLFALTLLNRHNRIPFTLCACVWYSFCTSVVGGVGFSGSMAIFSSIISVIGYVGCSWTMPAFFTVQLGRRWCRLLQENACLLIYSASYLYLIKPITWTVQLGSRWCRLLQENACLLIYSASYLYLIKPITWTVQLGNRWCRVLLDNACFKLWSLMPLSFL